VSSSRLSQSVGSVGWAIVDAAPDGILLVEQGGEIVLANRRAEGIFGYGRGGLLHRPVEELLPTRLRARHEEHRAAFAVAPVTRPMGAGILLHGLRADGVEFPIEVSLSPFNEGSARLTIAIVRDVSDAQLARETASELALDQERDRLAHELLDSIVRRLFDVGLTLTAQIAERHEVGDATHAVIDEIDETIREIRRIVFEARWQSPPRPRYW
jgi:PAS domain S-box-containing protein